MIIWLVRKRGIMLDSIKVFALGGLDELGKNMIVVEVNDDIFILDCGLKFPNKTTPGIDFLIPNLDYIKNNAHRVKAYFISHPHDEQIGALPFFYEYAPAPVYVTNYGKTVITRRTIFANKRLNYNFIVVKPTSRHLVAGHEVQLFQTCHNAYDSFGVAILTNRGYVVYSSEFIVDYDTKYKSFLFDLPALSKIAEKETLLLMCESLGATYEGYCSPSHCFINHIKQYFNNNQGRLFIGAFWQNSFNLNEILQLCLENNKKIVYFDMLTKYIIENLQADGIINIPKDNLINYEDVLRYRSQDEVFIILGHGENLFEKIQQLCHKDNEDKRIFLNETDTFLLCAPPSDNLEDLFTKTVDELFKTHANVVYLKRKDAASMHARSNDLKMMLSLLKPKYYLPVRGSYVQLLANAKIALGMGIGLNHTNVFVLDNGSVVNFKKDEIRPTLDNKENIEASEVIIDGIGVGDVSEEVLQERNKLSYGGVVVIASSISLSEKKIITKPDCQMRGFVFVKDAEPILKSVTNIYIEEVNNALKNSDKGFNRKQVYEVIKDRVSKAIRHHLRRDPVVVPIIIETE